MISDKRLQNVVLLKKLVPEIKNRRVGLRLIKEILMNHNLVSRLIGIILSSMNNKGCRHLGEDLLPNEGLLPIEDILTEEVLPNEGASDILNTIAGAVLKSLGRIEGFLPIEDYHPIGGVLAGN